MSSDQIDPADLTQPGQDQGDGESEVLERLQQLWTKPADKSPSPFLQTHLDHIDRFEIIRMLGQGGMGRVYLAIDTKLDRKVAIKVPLFDSDTDPTILERFRREGRAAGSVSHPNVVAVHEVGDTDQGCYIVSEYVEGPTLREYLAQHGKRLNARTAARLVAAIARGVQAAHVQGVIHRDLKPSNILLQRRSADHAESPADLTDVQIDDEIIRPQVADFGLAGFVDHRTAITMSGALVGTPSYMAPEQITGVPLGPQADVFSLGVILYELVTGKSPFAGESYVATIDRVQHHDPPPLTKTHSGIPRDLSAICECAISKEPTRRYSTAGGLADDLARYLAGQPVRARSLGPTGRFQRWVRRHPARAALAGVTCAALAWSLIQNGRLTNTAAELQTANAKYRQTIYVQDMIAAFDALDKHATDDVRSLLARHVPEDADADLRGIEWYALHGLIETNQPKEFSALEGEVYDLAVTPDGRKFFSVGEDRRRRLWDLESGKQIRVSEPELVGRSHAIAISPDGKTFVTGGNFLMAHDVASGSIVNPTPITQHEYGIRAIAISPDQQLVASLCLQHQIHLNSLNPEKPYANRDIAIPAQLCTRIDFSPDGRRLYFTKQIEPRGEKRVLSRQFVVWDIESEQKSFSSPSKYYSGYFGPVDASDDGKLVAIGGFRHVQLYHPSSNRFQDRIVTTESRVLDVEFSPDQSRIAGGSQDGTLFTSNLKAGVSPGLSAVTSFRTRPYKDAINAVAWVDNQRILTGDDAGRILLHTIADSQHARHFEDAHTCQLDQSGRRLLVINNDGVATLFDVASLKVLQRSEGLPQATPRRICLGPSGRYLAVSEQNLVQVWDLESRAVQCKFEHVPRSLLDNGQSYPINSISISPDARYVATTGNGDGYALVWDLQTGNRVEEIALPKFSIGARVAYSPFGDYLLCVGTRGAVLVDLHSGQHRLLNIARISGVLWISPTELMISGESGLLARYNVNSGELDSVFSNQTHIASRMAISPDQRTLVTGNNQFVHYWHLPTRRLMGRIPKGTESFAFSPDGDKLYMTTRNSDANSRQLRVISKEVPSPRSR